MGLEAEWPANGILPPPPTTDPLTNNVQCLGPPGDVRYGTGWFNLCFLPPTPPLLLLLLHWLQLLLLLLLLLQRLPPSLVAAVVPLALLHDAIKAVRKECMIWRVDFDPTCWLIWTIVLKAE